MKAISAVIATVMLLMISVAMIGVFYAFSSTMTTTTTSSGEEQVTQLTNQLSSCMRIENINGNKVDLKNCGKGVIDNKSLVVTMDDTKLGASTNTINEDSSGTINVTGLWQIQPGKHNLKISNGATFAQALVDVQPNKDGLVGSWGFESVDGTNYTIDASGNGNNGKLVNYTCNPAACGLADGKIGKGLTFDGVNDYTALNSEAVLDLSHSTIEFWMKKTDTTKQRIFSRSKPPSSNAFIEISGTQFWVEPDTNNGFTIQLNTVLNPSDGQWHKYGIIFTPGTGSTNKLELYADGIKRSEMSEDEVAGFDTSLSIRYMGLNASSTSYGNFLNGMLDEVRIWNRALSPDEAVVMKQLI